MLSPPKSGLIEVEITGMAFGGLAIGRVQGKVVFVRGALPGERVLVRIEQDRRSYMFAATTEVLRASPERVAPPCPLFGRCGGCCFLHWSYAAQLRAKTEWIREALRKFPDVAESLPEVQPAADVLRFRNRMEYSVLQLKSGEFRFGLHAARSDRILSTPACLLPSCGMLDLCRRAMAALPKSGFAAYRLDVRESRHAEERMLTLFASPRRRIRDHDAMAQELAPMCSHLYRCEAGPGPAHRRRMSFRRLTGNGVMIERVGGLDFEITPDTFFQTNTRQAERMVEYAREEVAQHPAHNVLDLFAGTGLFALSLAANGCAVWGIEASGPAVTVARRNAERNGINGAKFARGSAESAAASFRDTRIDLAVVDPPRGGLTPDARRELISLHPNRILYVSCNPATLARDLQDFATSGYRVNSARGFDLFPQTAHIECIVGLNLGQRHIHP